MHVGCVTCHLLLLNLVSVRNVEEDAGDQNICKYSPFNRLCPA
jgi:hypothetical protein